MLHAQDLLKIVLNVQVCSKALHKDFVMKFKSKKAIYLTFPRPGYCYSPQDHEDWETKSLDPYKTAHTHFFTKNCTDVGALGSAKHIKSPLVFPILFASSPSVKVENNYKICTTTSRELAPGEGV